MIVKKEDKLFPFEIKTSMTPNKIFSRHRLSFVEYEENAKKPRIIYAGESYLSFNGVEYVNFKDLGKYLNAF